MRKIIFIILLSMPAWAADVVENIETMFSTSNIEERIQGIPRRSVCPIGGGVVIFYMGDYVSSVYEEFFRMTSYGQTWGDSLYVSANLYNHAHLNERGDTIYCWGNDYTQLTLGRLYRINATSGLTFIDSVDIDSADNDDDIYMSAFYKGGDSMVALAREPDAMSITYALSGDKGATWVFQGDLYAYDQDTRALLMEFGDSVCALIYRRHGTRGYDFFYYYEGSWSTADTIISGAEFERLYSGVMGKDLTVHLAFSDTSNPSHVIHCWRNPSTGIWAIDTPYTASQQVKVTGGLWTAMGYSEYAERTRLFYTSASGAIPDDLVCIEWNYATSSWGADTTVITDENADTVRNLSGCLNVPESDSDRVYIAYMVDESDTWYTKLATIVDSTAHPKTYNIADGGVIDGGKIH